MEGGSFDPRQWQLQGPAKSPATYGSKAGSLPEFWREAAGDTQTSMTGAEPATLRSVPGARGVARFLPFAASLTILAIATSVAWVQRDTPAGAGDNAAFAADVRTASVPEADRKTSVERALSLSSAAELESALISAGVPASEASAATAAAASALGQPGEVHAVMVLVQEGQGLHLHRLQASYADGSGATVDRQTDGSYTANRVAADLTRKIQVVRGELDSESFYSSAVAAGLVDSVIPEFINAFAFDFNLASEVSPGDTFEVALEQSVNGRGEAVGAPKLLYASLTTATKSRALYRYQPAGSEAAWYDGNGGSIKRGLMRTPIDGARITSKFGMRFHPVLHYNRLHGGVDFAAPVGTPIYAAAEGTVSSASPSKCAGNMVIIQHANGLETRYFHLSRYADGLHAGEKVQQGFTVGFVGNTGTCTTGPHLHYETHVNGEKVDPLSIPVDDSKRKLLEGSLLAGFMRERDRIDVARSQQAY